MQGKCLEHRLHFFGRSGMSRPAQLGENLLEARQAWTGKPANTVKQLRPPPRALREHAGKQPRQWVKVLRFKQHLQRWDKYALPEETFGALRRFDGLARAFGGIDRPELR